jgi:hypothetical protein
MFGNFCAANDEFFFVKVLFIKLQPLLESIAERYARIYGWQTVNTMPFPCGVESLTAAGLIDSVLIQHCGLFEHSPHLILCFPILSLSGNGLVDKGSTFAFYPF